jgi:hypothetical protein
MITKVREHLLVLLLVQLLLTSCATTSSPTFADPQIMELGAKATQWGLQRAMQGAPNTHILTDGKLVFALWPLDGYWAGACINCGVKDPMGHFRYLTGGRGMVFTWRGMSEMVRYLVDEHGWTSMPASTLAKTELFATLANQLSSFSGFLVVPAGLFIEPEVFERPEG